VKTKQRKGKKKLKKDYSPLTGCKLLIILEAAHAPYWVMKSSGGFNNITNLI
jgi:hypothetical protein